MRQVTHRTVKVMCVAAVATALVLACDIGGGGGGGGGGGTSPTSDFTQISGSGTITLRIQGASSDHSGADLMYGASGIFFGQDERLGDGTTITSNDMSLTIPDPTSGYFMFTGGDTVGFVGCIIDLDGSGTANDGDYYAGQSDVTVNGNRTIEFTYPGDFTQITGSGTITIEVNGADTGGHGDDTLMYGASGIPFGMYERTGGDTTISSDAMSLIIPDPGSGDFVFAGGETIENVGCVIDVDGDGIADDGDYYAMEHDVVMTGAHTITFTYPGDFTQITESGTVTIQVEGANADHNGASLMYGAAGIPFGQFERSGNDTVISSDTVAVTIPHPVSGDFVFTGGDTIAGMGAIIDVNANDRADDGDLYAKRLNLSISGDRTVTFEY